MSVTSSFRSESSPSLCTDPPPHPHQEKFEKGLPSTNFPEGSGVFTQASRVPTISNVLDLNTRNTTPPPPEQNF